MSEEIIKAPTLYNLYRQGKIKGCLLRVEGQTSGVRLWHLPGIRDFIAEQMALQKLDSTTAA